ncbi:MAG: ISAs1 family transposase [Legionellaceae bacterium]|nr:ISAs1 family transposase [Legionellaceae bacterium]
MSTKDKPGFLYHFDALQDPRIDRKKLYPLTEILFVVVCASICGAQSWRDFVTFGEEKLDYLRRFLPFDNGIPSKNTYARVFSSLNPDEFKTCFVSWVQSFQQVLGNLIAIDGKTLRKSFDKANQQSAIHMVSAFATASKLVLGQQKVDDKSNEITAIPKLLDLLSLEGMIVSIDAMGTQKEIANQIIEKNADYVLALKGNNSRLHDDIRLFLETEAGKKQGSKLTGSCEEIDKGHGRVEQRTCYVSDQIHWLEQQEQWRNLKSIIMVESCITVGEHTTTERRYFISSLPANAKKVSEAIRSHWAVENSLHWVLDVTLREDDCRVRKDHAPENMAMVRHIILNMLQNTKKKFKDMSIRRLQKKAGWGDSTLDMILMAAF